MVFANLARLAWLPFADSRINVEEYADGDAYVVRAELPGFDPTRNIQLALVDGELRIRGERFRNRQPKGHSDFHYGSFYRGVPLPITVRPDAIKARYDRGILEVRIGLDTHRLRGWDIPVEVVDTEAKWSPGVPE